MNRRGMIKMIPAEASARLAPDVDLLTTKFISLSSTVNLNQGKLEVAAQAAAADVVLFGPEATICSELEPCQQIPSGSARVLPRNRSLLEQRQDRCLTGRVSGQLG